MDSDKCSKTGHGSSGTGFYNRSTMHIERTLRVCIFAFSVFLSISLAKGQTDFDSYKNEMRLLLSELDEVYQPSRDKIVDAHYLSQNIKPSLQDAQFVGDNREEATDAVRRLEQHEAAFNASVVDGCDRYDVMSTLNSTFGNTNGEDVMGYLSAHEEWVKLLGYAQQQAESDIENKRPFTLNVPRRGNIRRLSDKLSGGEGAGRRLLAGEEEVFSAISQMASVAATENTRLRVTDQQFQDVESGIATAAGMRDIPVVWALTVLLVNENATRLVLSESWNVFVSELSGLQDEGEEQVFYQSQAASSYALFYDTQDDSFTKWLHYNDTVNATAVLTPHQDPATNEARDGACVAQDNLSNQKVETEVTAALLLVKIANAAVAEADQILVNSPLSGDANVARVGWSQVQQLMAARDEILQEAEQLTAKMDAFVSFQDNPLYNLVRCGYPTNSTTASLYADKQLLLRGVLVAVAQLHVSMITKFQTELLTPQDSPDNDDGFNAGIISGASLFTEIKGAVVQLVSTSTSFLDTAATGSDFTDLLQTPENFTSGEIDAQLDLAVDSLEKQKAAFDYLSEVVKTADSLVNSLAAIASISPNANAMSEYWEWSETGVIQFTLDDRGVLSDWTQRSIDATRKWRSEVDKFEEVPSTSTLAAYERNELLISSSASRTAQEYWFQTMRASADDVGETTRTAIEKSISLLGEMNSLIGVDSEFTDIFSQVVQLRKSDVLVQKVLMTLIKEQAVYEVEVNKIFVGSKDLDLNPVDSLWWDKVEQLAADAETKYTVLSIAIDACVEEPACKSLLVYDSAATSSNSLFVAVLSARESAAEAKQLVEGALTPASDSHVAFRDSAHVDLSTSPTHTTDAMSPDGTVMIHVTADIDPRANRRPFFALGKWSPGQYSMEGGRGPANKDESTTEACSCATVGQVGMLNYNATEANTYTSTALSNLFSDLSKYHTYFPPGEYVGIDDLQTLWSNSDDTENPFYDGHGLDTQHRKFDFDPVVCEAPDSSSASQRSFKNLVQGVTFGPKTKDKTRPDLDDRVQSMTWHVGVNVHDSLAFCGGTRDEDNNVDVPNRGITFPSESSIVAGSSYSEVSRTYNFELTYGYLGRVDTSGEPDPTLHFMKTEVKVLLRTDPTTGMPVYSEDGSLVWASLASDRCTDEFPLTAEEFSEPYVTYNANGTSARLNVWYVVEYSRIPRDFVVGPRVKPEYDTNEWVWKQNQDVDSYGNRDEYKTPVDENTLEDWDVFVPKSVRECTGLAVKGIFPDDRTKSNILTGPNKHIEMRDPNSNVASFCVDMPADENSSNGERLCRYVLHLQTPEFSLREDGKTFSHTCPARLRALDDQRSFEEDSTLMALSSNNLDAAQDAVNWKLPDSEWDLSWMTSVNSLGYGFNRGSEAGGAFEGVRQLTVLIRPHKCLKPTNRTMESLVIEDSSSFVYTDVTSSTPHNCRPLCYGTGPTALTHDRVTSSVTLLFKPQKISTLEIQHVADSFILPTNILSVPPGVNTPSQRQRANADSSELDLRVPELSVPDTASAKIISHAQAEHARKVLRFHACALAQTNDPPFLIFHDRNNIDATDKMCKGTEFCSTADITWGTGECENLDRLYPTPVSVTADPYLELYPLPSTTNGLCVYVYNKFFSTWDEPDAHMQLQMDELMIEVGYVDAKFGRVFIYRGDKINAAGGESPSNYLVVMNQTRYSDRSTIDSTNLIGSTDDPFLPSGVLGHSVVDTSGMTWATVLDMLTTPSREMARNKRWDGSTYESTFPNDSPVGTSMITRPTLPFVARRTHKSPGPERPEADSEGDVTGVDGFCLHPPMFHEFLTKALGDTQFEARFYRFTNTAVYVPEDIEYNSRRRLLSPATLNLQIMITSSSHVLPADQAHNNTQCTITNVDDHVTRLGAHRILFDGKTYTDTLTWTLLDDYFLGVANGSTQGLMLAISFATVVLGVFLTTCLQLLLSAWYDNKI
jgi:hypothetical protein